MNLVLSGAFPLCSDSQAVSSALRFAQPTPERMRDKPAGAGYLSPGICCRSHKR